jgi:hypothetical protein
VTPPAAFYCVADDRYFPGAVGLINSLRLVGHTESIHLLDCGLTGSQRELLAGEAELVTAPDARPPWLLKTVAPLARPADVMVLLDTDLVATRSLAPLIERAAEGRIVAFADPADRYDPGWGELLGLGETRRGTYVSSAVVCADRELGAELLGLLSERQSVVDFERTFWRSDEPGYPFRFADQDVLNAILSTRIESDGLEALEARLAPTPPFTGLRLDDERTLRCSYSDGAEPFFVHHHVVRPWLEPTHHGVYSRLLRRLLISDDVAISVPEDAIAPWLRSGPRAWARRISINARERLRWHVREPLARRRAGA